MSYLCEATYVRVIYPVFRRLIYQRFKLRCEGTEVNFPKYRWNLPMEVIVIEIRGKIVYDINIIADTNY